MCVVNWLPLRSRPYSGRASGREGLSLPLSSSPEHPAGEGRKEGLVFPPATCWVFPLGGRRACLEIGSSPAWPSVWFCLCSFLLGPLAQAPTPALHQFVLSPARAFDVRLSSGEQSELLHWPDPGGVGCGGWAGRANEQRHWGGVGGAGKGRAAAPCPPALGWGTRPG